MALTKFTSKIISGKPIQLYSKGKHSRDFTYNDDIVSAIKKIIDDKVSKKRNLSEIINISSGQSIKLAYFVSLIEKNLNTKANIELVPPQPGDMKDTFADTKKIKQLYNWKPTTKVEEGLLVILIGIKIL